MFVAFAFAHWAWIKIATSVPVSVFSISMLIIPVVGVMSGILFLGERPNWAEYAALALVLAALLTVLRPGRAAAG
ncbi:EamA-like transporter family protein [compost metagenome]